MASMAANFHPVQLERASAFTSANFGGHVHYPYLQQVSRKEPLIDGSRRENSPTDGKDVREKRSSSLAWLRDELRMQFWLAWPMACVSLLQFALNVASVMFVGHLGELALASASLASSIGSVTGFTLLYGMSSALDTLCGQAYGAKQYHLLGTYLQRAIVVLNVSCIPIAIVWYNIGTVLRAIGQDPEIANYAGLYARWMLPSLFGLAFLEPMVKFMQTQSAVLPMAYCSALTLCIHIPLCWLIVYKLEVGYCGAAIANSLSTWLNVIFLAIYVKCSTTCKQTWVGLTSEAFHAMPAFFKLAVPSAAMICLEFWCFELLVLMSGLLPNPQLEMSAFAVCLNFMGLMYMIPCGLMASVSTRVSNELGAGRPSAAKRAMVVGVSLGLAGGLTASTITFSFRRVWPLAFTSEPELVDYVSKMTPYIAVLQILDSSQGVLSGVTRGSGSQDLGAYSNLGSYYGVGTPLGIFLAFYCHKNGQGLWLGLIAALVVQTTCLLLISIYTDWEKQAQKAADRVYSDQLPNGDIAVHKDESESPLILQ